MANEMIRMAGRDPETGTAKAVRTDAEGNIGIKATGNEVNEINTTATLSAGEGSIVSGDMSKAISKTSYVYAENDGYAGIEVLLNNKWLPLLKVKNEHFKDDFTGTDSPLNSNLWQVAKMGTYNTDFTYAKVVNDKLSVSVRSNSGSSHTFVTSVKKVTVSTEKIIRFTVDETKFPSGITSELNIGFVPTQPIEGGTTGIAGRTFELKLTQGKLVNYEDSTEYVISTLDSQAKYQVISTPTTRKVYRNGILIFDKTRTLPETEYFMYLQLTASASAATRVVDINNFLLWSKNEDAKVTGKELWAKTTTDVIPSEMRVVFESDIDKSNEVFISLTGQA
jgi:hypothetical protein